MLALVPLEAHGTVQTTQYLAVQCIVVKSSVSIKTLCPTRRSSERSPEGLWNMFERIRL